MILKIVKYIYIYILFLLIFLLYFIKKKKKKDFIVKKCKLIKTIY